MMVYAIGLAGETGLPGGCPVGATIAAGAADPGRSAAWAAAASAGPAAVGRSWRNRTKGCRRSPQRPAAVTSS